MVPIRQHDLDHTDHQIKQIIQIKQLIQIIQVRNVSFPEIKKHQAGIGNLHEVWDIPAGQTYSRTLLNTHHTLFFSSQ